MFDFDSRFDRYAGDVSDLDEATALSVAVELRADADRAEARLLQVAVQIADLHPEPEVFRNDSRWLPGMERTKVYGGDGCPEVAEFAPIELGAALGVTSRAAADLIGDALALRHRLPRLWARVLAGQVQAWRAREIAHACWPLTQQAAALVDERVAGIAQSLTSYRLGKVVKAAVKDADPDQARKDADQEKAERGVWVGQSDAHGTKTIFVRAAAGDVIRFEATTDQIADLLGQLGDTDSKDLRRAKAIGWLASPHALLELWQAAQENLASSPPDNPTQQNTAHDTPPDAPDDPDAAAAPDAPSEADHPDNSHPDRAPAPDPNPDEPDVPPRAGLRKPAQPGQTSPITGPGDPGGTGGTGGRGGGLGGLGGLGGGLGRYTLYLHLTDHTLASGTGIIRAADTATKTLHKAGGLGPQLASQLAELLGDPRLIDKITVKPVIDLADRVSVDAYEIPHRIRERVTLRYLTCIFPYCNCPATDNIDLDHVVPYHHGDHNNGDQNSGDQNSTGPPGQTSTENLAPACRLHHRIKTHSRWTVRRLPDGAFEWTSPQGHRYRVDHTGTHPTTN